MPDASHHIQSVWDRPSLKSDKAVLAASFATSFQQATFLAPGAPHSGDWLLVMPIVSCNLKLEDEVIRIAVGLRLGLDL